jgi:flagellar biosynthesis GTPase FlhF
VIAAAIPEVPRPEEPPRPAPLPAVSHHAAPQAPDEIEPLREALVAHGLEPRMADALVHETVTNVLPFAGAGPRVRALLTATIANHIPVRPIPAAPGRVIAFVGPGGAGKTHCVGHLAGAYASGSGLPVSCVALRPRDAGSELALSPRAKADVRALAAALKAVGADEVVITVPATSSAAAARELLAAGRRLGAGAVALTHADETDHVGPAIGVAMESGLPFAYVGRRPNGRPAVRPAVGEELARALLTSAGGSSRR